MQWSIIKWSRAYLIVMKIENCSMSYAHTRSRSSKNEIGKKMITILGKRDVSRGIKKGRWDTSLGRLMTGTIDGAQMNVDILYCNVYWATRAIYFEKSRIPRRFDDMIYYSEGCSIIDRPLRSFLSLTTFSSSL